MFVTKNQFYIFVACFAFGAFCGVIFSVASIFNKAIKNKIACFFIDIILMCLYSVLFSIYSYKFNFSDLRAYMLFGILIGFIAYLKSFHIILAKLLKKIYNIINLKIKMLRVRRNDRRKSKKSDSGINGGGSPSISNTDFYHGVPNNFH